MLLNVLLTLQKLRRLDPASRKHSLQRALLLVSAAKYCCDLGQALPAALMWDSPPVFDTLCGLSSGLLSTYKIWVEGAK